MDGLMLTVNPCASLFW